MAPANQLPIDFAKLVDALHNRNEPPQIVGGWDTAFDPKYDFNEQKRVDKIIDTMMIFTEEVWPLMVGHLGDKRYSYTIGFDDTTYNYSIGDVCEQIIHNTLEAGFVRSLNILKGTNLHVKDFENPELYDDAETLKTWLITRKDRKLYELQIEVLEWIIKRTEELGIPEDKRREFIEQINEDILYLRKEKEPYIKRKFIPYNEVWTYMKADDADARH
jgi:hypothetical protein